MDEQTRLLALAHLRNGTKPADVAELMGISYGAALKLRKELHAAEQNDRILELFKLDEAALEILLKSVTQQLTPAIEAFGIGELVEEEVHKLASGINGASLLSEELQDAARALTKKITTAAVIATNSDTIFQLSKALVELQGAFKSSDISSLAQTSFEKHLSK